MLTPVDAQSRRLDVGVRPERDDAVEVAAIARVVAAAFGSTVEADLVAAIRKSGNLLAGGSLVAEHDGTIVGHVMVSHVALDGPAGERPVGLARAARRGARRPNDGGSVRGRSTLVRAVLAVCERAGEPLVVLEGEARSTTRSSDSSRLLASASPFTCPTGRRPRLPRCTA